MHAQRGVTGFSSNDPFFIFTCGRSGSSLLARMLDAHPRLAIPNESHLFDTFYPLLKYYGNLRIRRNRERLIDDILSTHRMREWSPQLARSEVLSSILVPDFSGIVDAVLRTWANIHHKPRWGEKTPKHLFFWREIVECFPNARIIHIVRDGRDVALSWIRAPFGPKTVYTAGKRWANDLEEVENLRAAIAPEAFCEVLYEDLLEKPEETLSEVCAFLGEPYATQMLEFYTNPAGYVTDTSNRENLRKPLLRDNKQKWRTQMRPGDLRVFEAVAGETLIRYGFDVASSDRSVSKTEALYRRFVENPPKKVAAMVKNRRGQANAFDQLRLKARLACIDRFPYRA